MTLISKFLIICLISASATFIPSLHNSFAMEAGKEENKSQQREYVTPTTIATSTTAAEKVGSTPPDYHQELEEKKQIVQFGPPLPPPVHNENVPSYSYWETKKEENR